MKCFKVHFNGKSLLSSIIQKAILRLLFKKFMGSKENRLLFLYVHAYLVTPIKTFLAHNKKRFVIFLIPEHFQTWLTEVYFPTVGSTSILLLDSWSGHCPVVAADNTPSDKKLILHKIPTGLTGKIQPLDVYGFRIWKNFVRHFSDSVILMNYDINLHLRNNIIKLQSLVHNQLSSPRYINMFKYSWFKSGYTVQKPEPFDNPVEFSFGESCKSHCEIQGCKNIAIIRCSWCKKSLCFKHFYEDYHFCSQYSA